MAESSNPTAASCISELMLSTLRGLPTRRNSDGVS
jgi:hypothetical protein